MMFRPGELIYHPESRRFAEVLSLDPIRVTGIFARTKAGKSYYPNLQNIPRKPSKHVLGRNVFSAIVDEVDFWPPPTVKVRWLDSKWSDATWDASKFVRKHPLELLGECA